ncbi:integrase catalytic domain-containing protein [Trichonephila clavata]|uniref:Integrase catalytic domain-containing protein n=1 Tax=Trichonephila clavata TaxID=2740835 RepID=A0A8X6GKM2_TRICU|nr:integrase catalytic domain-containing protein [Trichonephila clavata]
MFRGARKEEFILIADELGERINPEMEDNCNDELGKITLSSAFGEKVEAKLIKTSTALDNNSLNHPMDCLVAITDKLKAEALIPPSLYESLCSINDKTNKNENDIFAESVDGLTPFSNGENDAESGKEIFYVESDSDNLNFNSDYSKMKDEQNNCDSLEKVLKKSLPYPYETDCHDYLTEIEESSSPGPTNLMECIEQCKLKLSLLNHDCVLEFIWYPHNYQRCKPIWLMPERFPGDVYLFILQMLIATDSIMPLAHRLSNILDNTPKPLCRVHVQMSIIHRLTSVRERTVL